MSSRRRSRSRSRERARGSSNNASSKLRMDTKPQNTRITDPSLPAGRRREIDNVMKKARASPNSNIYWDKKLLEVEAKDPNRWRHSGYKSLYLDGSSSRSPSPGHLRRSRSRSRSLPPSRRSPRRSPRSPRSPPPGQLHRDSRRSPRSPPLPMTRVNRPGRPRSPPMMSSGGGGGNRGPPPSAQQQQQSAIRKRRSVSASSMSSCSDDSCSVCSPKAGRHRSRSRSRSPPRPVMPRPKLLPPAPTTDRRHGPQPSGSGKQPPPQRSQRPPSPNMVPSPRLLQHRMPRPMTPPPTAGGSNSNNHHPRRVPATIPPQRRSGSIGPPPTDPRRQPPPARPRNRAGELIDVSANVKPPPMPQPKIIPVQPVGKLARQTAEGAVGGSSEAEQPVLLSRIKKERTGAKNVNSPTNAGGDSSGSEDSSDNSTSAIVATTRLTLSERFGKMAQWSVDRERRIKDNNIENMRITKTGGDLKVMIEADAFLYGDAPRRYSISPVPAGHYPDDLLAAGPTIRGAAWDDVRVRYQYYKDLGYLRDLTLDDYVKWEEWWYKYQDWLTNEREYEHWLATQEQRGGGGHGHGGRRRRKRLPATQRLN